MNTKRTLLGLAIAAYALIGCGRPYRAATPEGFVDLGDKYPNDEYRAATADGVVIGIRAFDNEPKGTLKFWGRALENRMRDMGGYALIEKRAVKDAVGHEGIQLRFGHDEGKEPHLYYVALFVTDARIFLIEAGGTKAEMDREAQRVEWAIANFYPK